MFDFFKAKIKVNPKKVGIKNYLKNKKYVFDIGSGPDGSDWWKWTDKDTKIIGIDLYFFPKLIPKNIKIYKLDATLLNKLDLKSKLERLHRSLINSKFESENINWENRFDMVVANHILEHVNSPEKIINGIKRVAKKDAIIYVSFPDSKNFTDIFYHLIHSEGGGHIQKLTKDKVFKLFKKHGFKLIKCSIWPDNWKWFETLYDFKGRGIKYITQKEITYLANVFRKELTPRKGYYYGWEMVFKK